MKDLEQAAAQGKLSTGAVKNIRAWLTDPRYAEYAPLVAEEIRAGRWKQLDQVFWTVIPFGTGGRRGLMYPVGTNAINDRTIGESAQGLADYVKEQMAGGPLSCAIAYDTRHRSRHFAELSAEIMAAAGFTVWFLDGFRSTPELSLAVRYKQASCGIMVTASHNPPCDNAVKVYGSTGGQLLPPHDQGVIDRVMSVAEIKRIPLAEALRAGRIRYCQDEVDRAYVDSVKRVALAGPRDLKILYSPLHGVGCSAVCPVLAADGFADVEVFADHAEADPDFPNVPGHVANPENPAVFDSMIVRARQTGAGLILATDPDCDRLGAAAPRWYQPGAPWATLTGNQIGSLLADYLLSTYRQRGALRPDHYLVKTVVTTELMRRIGDDYGVTTIGDLMVGFKWIAGVIDDQGPEGFILGAEESYGFLAGTHCRDKDAGVASMLLAELAAREKAAGRTLHEKLDELFLRHGCHAEKQLSVTMPGFEGMQRMKALMAGFRTRPPQTVAGMPVAGVRDFAAGTVTPADGRPQPLSSPRGDLVMFDLEPGGNYVAVRPSGTEPKVKFYMFAYDPPAGIRDLEATKAALAARLATMEKDLRTLSGVG